MNSRIASEFYFICYICIYYTIKNIQGFTGCEKKLNTEFNWTDQSGWKWYFLPGKSQISKIIFGFVSSTNITLDHYSVHLVLISVVNLAQACCQFQGLMNLEVLRCHTPQNTEIDTMIKDEQTVVLSISLFVELSMI